MNNNTFHTEAMVAARLADIRRSADGRPGPRSLRRAFARRRRGSTSEVRD
jgi:hypothetical protein